MSTLNEIRLILDRLQKAGSYQDVFGPLKPPNEKSILRHQFGYLAKMVHPDHNPGIDLANKTFDLLNEMWKAAEIALDNNTYDKPIVKATPNQLIKSATNAYYIGPLYTVGEFSKLYKATLANDVSQEFLIKIAVQPTFNSLLEKEVRIIRKFKTPLSNYLPMVHDSFFIADGSKRYRVTVFPFNKNLVSLTDIKDKIPELDPRDAAWIARRVFAQVLAARVGNVTHGSIVPSHILVDPIKHEPLHIGWTHAVESAGRVNSIIDKWKDWYPPEIIKKQQPSHRSDIYMAGKTVKWLFGKEFDKLPTEINTLIKSCITTDINRRPESASWVFETFTKLIREAWGKQYRELKLPS